MSKKPSYWIKSGKKCVHPYSKNSDGVKYWGYFVKLADEPKLPVGQHMVTWEQLRTVHPKFCPLCGKRLPWKDNGFEAKYKKPWWYKGKKSKRRLTK